MKTYITSALLLCFLALPAQSAVINLTASLDGAQASGGAGTGSNGTGSATMNYDDISGLFSWNIAWENLLETATVMHFHGPAGPGTNAGVQVDFGSISGTSSPSIGSTSITGAQGNDLVAGLWYINIHSTSHPGGEIRGQVNVIPIPAAAWLFGSALLGLVGIGRSREKV